MRKLALLLSLCVALICSCLLAGCALFFVSDDGLPGQDSTGNSTSQSMGQSTSQSLSGAQKEVRYNARYAFEQVSMPQFVFQNQAEFIECLQTSDLASAEREIRAIWKYSTEEFFITMFTQEEREHAAQGNEQLYELLDPMTLEFGLGAEHIAEITFEEIDRNSSCILIEMLELDELLLCTFIAIVDKGEDGLAYYTVERTYGSEEDERAYMFCFVEQQGRGSIGTIESTKESVLEAIRQTSV